MSVSPYLARLERPGRLRSSVRMLRQFMRFLIVGVLSFAVDYGLYIVLLNWLQYIVASSISFTISLVLNYYLTLRFVFKARPGRSMVREFVAFVALNMVALGLNQLCLFLAVAGLGVSEVAGKIIATAVVLVYNFISRKLLIEPPPRRGSRSSVTADEAGHPGEPGASATVIR